ncbi:nuclear transport factor 2 family protein [Candidatus Bathyarchaeota archaeon]|nr:nuclear transport factor 2 family protein [Candidatus Bathyarchaeota archaeon]
MIERDHEHDETTIRKIIENMGEAFQSKDVEGFVRPFQEDALALFTGLPLMKGVVELRRFITEAVKDIVSIDYEWIITKAWESSGYAVGCYRAVSKINGGLDEHKSRFLASFIKCDGEWKIMAICYNRPN